MARPEGPPRLPPIEAPSSRRRRTLTRDIFSGALDSRVCCVACGATTRVSERFFDLSLPVPLTDGSSSEDNAEDPEPTAAATHPVTGTFQCNATCLHLSNESDAVGRYGNHEGIAENDERYTTCDNEDLTAAALCSRIAGLGRVASGLQREERVMLWNRSSKSKVVGSQAPMRSALEKFLGDHETV